MKKHLVLLSALLLQAAAVSVFAQDKPKAGDLITGVVTGGNVPITMVHIMELDSVHDYYVTDTRTDSTGRFSLRLVNPENQVLISCKDYEPVWINDFTQSYYEISLKPAAPIQPIKILDGPNEITTLPAVVSDEKLPLPVAGSTVTGYVKSDEGPLERACVIEIAGIDSLVDFYYTDENGFFSFEIADPNDSLMISYIGHETIKVAIDRTEYDIILKGRKDMTTVDVDADRKIVLY